jgi:Zn-dependent M28 family amino/carboxypeptidase
VEFSPGACDDGSGVVVLLELLSNLINDLTITFTDVHLIVLLTNGEEMGLLGSQAFITNHPWRSNIHRFINVDGVSCKEKAYLVRMKPSKVVFYIDLSDLYSSLFFVVVVDYGL